MNLLNPAFYQKFSIQPTRLSPLVPLTSSSSSILDFSNDDHIPEAGAVDEYYDSFIEVMDGLKSERRQQQYIFKDADEIYLTQTPDSNGRHWAVMTDPSDNSILAYQTQKPPQNKKLKKNLYHEPVYEKSVEIKNDAKELRVAVSLNDDEFFIRQVTFFDHDFPDDPLSCLLMRLPLACLGEFLGLNDKILLKYNFSAPMILSAMIFRELSSLLEEGIDFRMVQSTESISSQHDNEELSKIMAEILIGEKSFAVRSLNEVTDGEDLFPVVLIYSNDTSDFCKIELYQKKLSPLPFFSKSLTLRSLLNYITTGLDKKLTDTGSYPVYMPMHV